MGAARPYNPHRRHTALGFESPMNLDRHHTPGLTKLSVEDEAAADVNHQVG